MASNRSTLAMPSYTHPRAATMHTNRRQCNNTEDQQITARLAAYTQLCMQFEKDGMPKADAAREAMRTVMAGRVVRCKARGWIWKAK